jgi:hypothetical protein
MDELQQHSETYRQRIAGQQLTTIELRELHGERSNAVRDDSLSTTARKRARAEAMEIMELIVEETPDHDPHDMVEGLRKNGGFGQAEAVQRTLANREVKSNIAEIEQMLAGGAGNRQALEASLERELQKLNVLPSYMVAESKRKSMMQESQTMVTAQQA